MRVNRKRLSALIALCLFVAGVFWLIEQMIEGQRSMRSYMTEENNEKIIQQKAIDSGLSKFDWLKKAEKECLKSAKELAEKASKEDGGIYWLYLEGETSSLLQDSCNKPHFITAIVAPIDAWAEYISEYWFKLVAGFAALLAGAVAMGWAICYGLPFLVLSGIRWITAPEK